METENSDDVETENSDDVETENSDDVETENGDDVETENSDDVETENRDDVETENREDVETDNESDKAEPSSSDGLSLSNAVANTTFPDVEAALDNMCRDLQQEEVDDFEETVEETYEDSETAGYARYFTEEEEEEEEVYPDPTEVSDYFNPAAAARHTVTGPARRHAAATSHNPGRPFTTGTTRVAPQSSSPPASRKALSLASQTEEVYDGFDYNVYGPVIQAASRSRVFRPLPPLATIPSPSSRTESSQILRPPPRPPRGIPVQSPAPHNNESVNVLSMRGQPTSALSTPSGHTASDVPSVPGGRRAPPPPPPPPRNSADAQRSRPPPDEEEYYAPLAVTSLARLGGDARPPRPPRRQPASSQPRSPAGGVPRVSGSRTYAYPSRLFPPSHAATTRHHNNNSSANHACSRTTTNTHDEEEEDEQEDYLEEDEEYREPEAQW
jgi:hypothetical protein